MTSTVLRNRVLGVVFVCLLLTGGWLTYAVFNKTFVDVVHVDVTTSRAGLQLPKHADVKMRGVIVGEVRSMASDGDGARLDLALSPGEGDRLPPSLLDSLKSQRGPADKPSDRIASYRQRRSF